MADDWRTPDAEALFHAIIRIDTPEEAVHFFRDLCTINELRDMAQRWAVARLLDAGMHYAEISRTTGASTATITRIASWLHHGEGGYRAMLDKIAGEGADATEAGLPAADTARAEGTR
jgi:TrpR-related protein YerC/YecD